MGSPLPPSASSPMAGTNRLQASIDNLARVLERNVSQSTVDRMASVSRAANVALNGGRIEYAPGGNADWRNRPNGGIVSPNNVLRFTPGDRHTRRSNGGHSSLPNAQQPTMNQGGGPGAGAGGGNATGSAFSFGGLSQGWETVVNYGNEQRPGQVAMDAYANYTASMQGRTLNGGLRRGYLGNIFGTPGRTVNAIGLNAGDIMAGDILRQRSAGGIGSYNYQQYGRNSAALNLATAGTLGSLNSVQVQNSLYSPQTYWRLRQMGMGQSFVGGQAQSASQIAEGFITRTFGNRRIGNEDMASQLAVGTAGAYNLDQLGLSGEAREALRDLIVQRNAARNAGVSVQEFDQLAEQATGPNFTREQRAAATRRLGQIEGINVKTLINAEKTIAGGKAQQDSTINEAFADSMRTATENVDAFNVAIGKIMNFGPIRWILGQSGGASVGNGLFNNLSGLISMANPASLAATGMGSLFGNAFNQLPGVGSQGPDAQGGQTGQPGGGSVGASSGGVSAARVISLMQSQAGDPYVYGGTGPNGWDCSGLVQWALRSAGFKGVPRTAGAQIKAIPGKFVPLTEIRPGDLLYRGSMGSSGGSNEHIAMYIGGGKTIEARGRQYGVGNFPSGGRSWTHAKRIFGSVGDTTSVTNAQSPGADSNMLSTRKTAGFGGGGNTGDSYGSSEEAALIAAALSGGAGAGPSLSTNSKGTLGTQPSDALDEAGVPSAPGAMGGKNAAAIAAAKSYAKGLLGSYGWGDQWKALETLWMKESGWRWWADNPTSDAYGIPQALPGKKMGKGWKTDAAAQIRWGLKYIKSRYGSPENAWGFWQKNNWYDSGAWEIAQDETARVHRGEMIVPAKQAQTIRDALLKESQFGSSKSSPGGSPTLSFGPGSVVIKVDGPVTESVGRSVARAFADELAREDVYSKISKGVTRA